MFTGPQGCTAQERADLVNLTNRVFRSGGGDMGSEYPLVFSAENLHYCRIIKEEGQVVSHVGLSIRDASILGCGVRVSLIGAVCTDAASRGKGYASLLMDDVHRLALDAGASLMLISGGRGLYHRLGYVTVGAFSSFQIDARRLPAVGSGLRLALCGRAEIPALVALNQHRPVRFLRPVEDWEKLLDAQMLMNRPADCLGIWDGGRLVAYAGTQRSTPGADGRPATPRVLEYGGAETALFAALSAVAAHYGAEAVELAAMPGSQDLPRLLRAAGAAERESPFGGTLGIINPERFFTATREYLHERLGAQAETLQIEPLATGGACFQCGDEEYRLETMGRLTALVFGGATEEARDLPLPSPRLGALLARVFPLPLLWYGYNYV